MTNVVAGGNESFESLLRRFTRKVQQDGVLSEVRHREYFEKKSSGKYAIQEQVKRLVKFGGINLLDSRATGRLRNVDCIFCRNVIIYFDDRHKVKCIENLYQSLRSGGYLFLGYSESLGRISNLFETVKLKKTVVYRKPDEASL